MHSSVIVGAAHVERVFSLEPEDDPILIGDANRMKPGQLVYQSVKPISRGHSELVERGH